MFDVRLFQSSVFCLRLLVAADGFLHRGADILPAAILFHSKPIFHEL